MYFGAGTSKLQHAIKSLRTHWDESQDGWRDQVRVDFEEQHIVPLDAQATNTLRAMHTIADLLARIQRDCS